MQINSVLKLLTGNVLAQLIGIIFIPVITRLFTPDDFGIYTLFITIVVFLGIFSTLRYEIAIALPSDNKKAIHVVIGGILVLIIMSIMNSLIIYTADLFFNSKVKEVGLDKYIYLIPVIVFFLGLFNIFSYYVLRSKEYGVVAFTRVKQVSFISISQIIFNSFGAIALILSYGVGQLVGFFSLFRVFRKDFLNTKCKLRDVVSVLIEYKKFPKYSVWGSLLNNLGQSMPVLLLSYIFGMQVAGFYALAYRLMVVPLNTISSAVSNYFLSVAGEQINNKEISKTILEILSSLIYLSFPIFGILFFISENIYIYILGENWRGIDLFVKALIPWLCCVFVISPISIFMELVGRQRENLIFQVFLFSVRLGALSYGFFSENIAETLFLFSAVSVICWLFFLFRILLLSEVNIKKMLMRVLVCIILVIILLLPLILHKSLMFNYSLSLCASLFFCVVYYVLLFKKMRVVFK